MNSQLQRRTKAIQLTARGMSWIVCFLLIAASSAFAQFLDQGAITGVVQDPSGAVIVGAEITLTNTNTQLQLHGVSNGSGIYNFSPIPIGHYQITVTAPGFEKMTQENISLDVQQRLSIPITLKAGAVSQSVIVTSAPPLLQTEESSVGQVVQTEQINETPLSGRNWVYMVQLTPGAVPANGSRAQTTGDFDANGMRPEENDFVLDGVDNNAVTADYLSFTSFFVNPPPDALAEFKVSTADYSAEFGHSAGAVVNASIKAGTNDIHGDLWEYWRNDILNARDFNALTVPKFRENLFGATLGMPFIKNKLFFFGDAQANRVVAAQAFTQSVPTDLERKGDFSELLNPNLTSNGAKVTLYEPNTAANTGGATPMVCNGQPNVLCANQIDTVAQNLLKLYPEPNANNGATYSNDVINLSQPQDTFQWDTRVDWNIRSKDQVFARFSYMNVISNRQPSLGTVLDGSGGNSAVNNSGNVIDYANNFVFSETHVFTTSLVNQFRFAYDYGHFGILQPNYGVDIASTLGLANMPFGTGFTDNGGLPNVTIGGNGGVAQFGTHAYRPELEFENEYQIFDNVTKTIGRHAINLGISLQSIRSYMLEPQYSHGLYQYSGLYTSQVGTANTGSGVADLLTGQMNSGGISPSAPVNHSQWYISGYAQDDWKVSNRLTVNLGVRYDWFQPYKELAGRQANFYPTGAPGVSTGAATIAYPSQDQSKLPLSAAFLQNLATDHITVSYTSNQGLSTGQKTNFAPRIGFAYRVEAATMVHGGFGIFYQGQEPSGAGGDLGSNYPFNFGDSFVAPSCANSSCPNVGYTLEQGFAAAVSTGLASYLSNPSLNGQSANLKTTYGMDYNLTVQRAVTTNLVASLGYVGTVGRHLPVIWNPNSSTVLVRPGVSTQSLLPFPAFGGATFIDYRGLSSYNSMQARLEKRMSHGLNFWASYVYSHALDDSSDALASSVGYRAPNIIPIRDDYSNSNWDVRHRVTFNGFYQLPFGAGRSYLNHAGWQDEIVGGWSANLAFQMESGQPFSVGTANVSTVGGGSTYAIRTGDPFKTGGTPDPSNPGITCATSTRNLTHWYNPCAFANPLSGTLLSPGVGPDGSPYTPMAGYSYPEYINGAASAKAFLGGRSNQVYGPGFQRTDVSMFKDFATFHEQKLQFRVDCFNLLNTPPYGNPTTSNISQSGGQIKGAERLVQSYTPGARFFQLSGKYIF
jgi:hypothetical protein